MFTCPNCGTTSHNPNDEKYGYCGRCHDFTGQQAPAEFRRSERPRRMRDESDVRGPFHG